MQRFPVLIVLVAFAPLAAATPLACADPCTIDSNSGGYVLPVTEIATGTSVVWTSQDITHIQRETSLASGADPCIEVPAQPIAPSLPVRFDVVGSALVATVADVSATCTNAIVTPAAALLLYHCTLHPNMRGALVVTV